MKVAVVLGAGGFIGHHLVSRLKTEDYFVIGADLKFPAYEETDADEFMQGDLADLDFASQVLSRVSEFGEVEIYQLAADMGGAGYIFTGDNDLAVMVNSSSINVNLARILSRDEFVERRSHIKVFYSSSACVYPEDIQQDADSVNLAESHAYPANPDSEYGWEKLFGERIFLTCARNLGIQVRVARFHNIYGPLGTWNGGREKAPAAICRKVAMAGDSGEIEIWGDGDQTRSFLFVEDCIEAVRRFMTQDGFMGPLNIGSEEMVSIRELVEITADCAGKSIAIKSIPGPTGVRGRNSNNDLIRRVLDWDYSHTLRQGIAKTYEWVSAQVEASK